MSPWSLFIEKLLKSELWVAIGTIVGSLLAPKLGIPPEHLTSLWASIGAVASAYILSRGHAKAADAKAVAAAVAANSDRAVAADPPVAVAASSTPEP